MTCRWMGTAAGAVLLAATAAAAGPARVHGPAYPAGAPAGNTGGFGEPTCRQCHVGEALNDPGGSLEIEGVPARYTPGATYRLVVRLRRAEMGAAGYQLAARTAAGAQAGRMEAEARATRVVEGPGGVLYAGHTEAGSAPTAPGAAEWTVRWTAPSRGAGIVRIHAAANAGDGDDSPIGDYVYAVERTAAPR